MPIYQYVTPFKIFTTFTAAELFEVWVNSLMTCLFKCYAEMLWTFTAKHTASHLHVDVNVSQSYHSGWTSSDKCDTSTKYLHCVTSADVSWVGQTLWNGLNSVYMSTAFHRCEHEHDTSVYCLSWTYSHSKDTHVVFCYFCYTVNTCTVYLPCGLSCDCLDFQTDLLLCGTRDICTVSLHCEFCCAKQLTWCCELFVANIASKWFLFWMTKFVYF